MKIKGLALLASSMLISTLSLAGTPSAFEAPRTLNFHSVYGAATTGSPLPQYDHACNIRYGQYVGQPLTIASVPVPPIFTKELVVSYLGISDEMYDFDPKNPQKNSDTYFSNGARGELRGHLLMLNLLEEQDHLRFHVVLKGGNSTGDFNCILEALQ